MRQLSAIGCIALLMAFAAPALGQTSGPPGQSTDDGGRNWGDDDTTATDDGASGGHSGSAGGTRGSSGASCWYHNGSLMRLEADGRRRSFYYEVPRQGLRRSGVREGTLLFEGRNDDGWYTGKARIFSRHCPDEPMEYDVEGPVSNGQRKVTMEGTRDVREFCEPTGRSKTDVLVFTYAFRC